MTHFMRKPAAGSQRTTALLAAAAAAALWGVAMAAQAGDTQPADPQQPAQSAAAAQSGAPAASTPAKPDPMDRVVCREEETTGTRLGGTRVCHTRRQWQQMENEAQDYLTEQKPH